jgi:hypothetical protein
MNESGWEDERMREMHFKSWGMFFFLRLAKHGDGEKKMPCKSGVVLATCRRWSKTRSVAEQL